MKYFDSFLLVYSEEYPTRTEAMKREYQLKQWPKAKKEELILNSPLRCYLQGNWCGNGIKS